ncbi:unnamed protein product [Closterium sp. Naga37s-1]|nr:unnamed protein product [Closterium sp. Naga37s-1]
MAPLLTTLTLPHALLCFPYLENFSGLIEQSYLILPPDTELTKGTQQQTVGRFMANPVNLFVYPPGVTSRCGLELAFRVNFTFAIFPQNRAARFNGFAFVIAANTTVGKPGGVGYAGSGARSMAVVFKTFQKNKQSGKQHVGLNINGVKKSLVAEVSPFTLTICAAGCTAWVDYEPGDPGTIQVFLADSAMKPDVPLLQTSLSLCAPSPKSPEIKETGPAMSLVSAPALALLPKHISLLLHPFLPLTALGLSLSEAMFAPSRSSPFSRYVSADFRLTPALSEAWSIHDLHSWDAVSWLGACWAYAVVASVEAAYGIAKKGRAPQVSVESLFAPMWLTNSNKCTAGGSPAHAFEKLVALNANGRSGLTRANDPATRYPVQSFERAQFKGYVGLMLAVRRQPVVVHIEASADTFKAYDGDPICYTGSVNHVVLVIGYFILFDDGSQNRIAPPFWIIRNSWGEDWGDKGHMRMDIQGGDGVCGINALPGIYPVVKMDVCGSYFKNPCYVGACINDGKGAYSCICPPNHVLSTTVDGFPTCDPGAATLPQAGAFGIVSLSCLTLPAHCACATTEGIAAMHDGLLHD